MYTLHIGKEPKAVYCDMEADGGGWTVIQRRQVGCNPPGYFYRQWKEYVDGFGDPEGEHWLGLEALHQITRGDVNMEMMVTISDFNGTTLSFLFYGFSVGSKGHLYALKYSSSTQDEKWDCFPKSGLKFSTYDADHDTHTTGNCAALYKGGWWYASCHCSNLNGLNLVGHHASYADGINWAKFRGYYYSLKSVEMKVRKKC